MNKITGIVIVKDGVATGTLGGPGDGAAWWVVRVRAAGDPRGLWCVYGGPTGAVLACLAEHARYAPIRTAVAYRFGDGPASLRARARIEKRYMTPRRPVAA